MYFRNGEDAADELWELCGLFTGLTFTQPEAENGPMIVKLTDNLRSTLSFKCSGTAFCNSSNAKSVDDWYAAYVLTCVDPQDLPVSQSKHNYFN